MTDPIDVFRDVPIFQDGTPRDLAWLRANFGRYLTGTWDRSKVTLRKIWTTEGSMTGTIRILTAGLAAETGYNVVWSWPGTTIPVATNDGGYADMYISEWIDQGERTPGREKGVFVASGGGWRFEGIGWAAATNHRKPNFEIVLAADHGTPSPDPGPTPPPTPPPAGDIKPQLNAIADTLAVIVEHLKALGR